MDPEEKLKEMGITLPDLPKPLGSYLPFVKTGSLIFISGMLPFRDGRLMANGRVGEAVTVEDAVQCARRAAINCLAVLKSAAGGLGKVKRCVRVGAFVASAPEFVDQPMVVNGASDLLFEVFGEAGKHARAAVGVHILPMNSPVEIEFVFEVES